MMYRVAHADVVIVGAGPVGLLTSVLLAERGTAVRLADKDRRGVAHSYALVLHPSSLDLLDQHGLTEPLLQEGRRVARIGIWIDGSRRGEVDLSRLAARFPFALVLPQSRLERALGGRLQAIGGTIEWNHRVQEVQAAADHVDVEIAELDQSVQGYPIARLEWVVARVSRTRCAYVVGADGYDSLVRRKLGLRTRSSQPAEFFCTFEFATEAEAPEDAALVFTGDRASMYWPLPGKRGRFMFEVESPSARTLDAATFRALVEERAPWFPERPTTFAWTSTVQFERRLVDAFGAGRAWLAGDAAHLTGPFGAQSMNVGLREASEVASLLHAALGGGGEGALARYEASRRDEWERLLGGDGAVAVLKGADPEIAARRGRLLAALPASGADLVALLGQLGLGMAEPAAPPHR